MGSFLAAPHAPHCRAGSDRLMTSSSAPVAQLDRALPSEGRSREFESRRARHEIKGLAELNFSVSRECPGEKPASSFPYPCPLLELAERTGGLANGAAGLFPSPALGERRHRSLARRLIAVGRMVAPTARGN